MKVFGNSVLALFLVAGVVVGADEPADKIPPAVRQAEKALTKWVDGLKGQTVEQIRDALGPPTKEETWGEDKELLLKYQIGKSTGLSLYFYEGHVIKASLHLLP